MDTVRVITDSSIQERQNIFRVGLLSGKREGEGKSCQAVISRASRQMDCSWEGVGKVILVKDAVGEGLLAIPAESLTEKISFPNCWEGLEQIIKLADSVDALPKLE